MFSKTPNNTTPSPTQPPRTEPTGQAAESAAALAARRPGQKLASLIANDMTVEGDISGGGELQIEGVIKGDVRVERVTVGEGGQVEGGVYAEAVEVRGRVSGSITAKQVRLYGECHVDGDITHEQLAMETGAFFQGRSLRLQRPAPAAQPSPTPIPRETAAAAKDTPPTKDTPPAPRDAANGGLAPKPSATP